MGYSGGEIIPYGGQNAMDMVHQCTGRKRALLIGINYIGQSHPLKGCINDAYRMRDLLTSLYNFHDNDMVILTDDSPDPRAQPTRANLIRAMHWLVANAQPTDSYFFHYSGHGTQTVDVSGDEIDGYDETILPVDFRTAGMILDDEMNAIMVRLLPLGCRLTAVFDSCHSGTALDLPFVYDYRGRLEKHPIVDATRDALGRVQTNYMAGDYYMAGRSVLESLRTVVRGPAIRRRQLRSRSTLGDVVMFSGCADDESSADSYDYALGNTGAMSNALVMVLRNNPNQSYAQILRSVRDILRGRYNQRPQLSTGRYMDMNRMFIL
ncbi:Ca(2+)-dependent cysteine protease [Tieghemiomyces parasiticus]|uniref:Ca(2+)-dependent cysteine protease n=1 Tax=Tieghemiomyces parasiticus TaxID=78921 RepID=A0A9W7ZN25_9FUNG|nr:Ca(2+)-dependent cysteine protease [Tieghemiomyces parasiticus]